MKSGRPYRGVNVFLLAVEAWGKGYESAYWLTFKQADERGGHVRRGEKSTPIVFWKQVEVEDRKTGEAKKVPILRYYRVFNLAQCEGLKAPDAEPYEPLDFTPIEAAQRIVDNYEDPPTIETVTHIPATSPHRTGCGCQSPSGSSVKRSGTRPSTTSSPTAQVMWIG